MRAGMKMTPGRAGAGALVVLAFAFLAAVTASQHLLGGLRLDLTENRLYTLSPGTRALLARIDEPIQLHFFFSERASRDYPALRAYATRVEEMLDEMSARADGKLAVRVLDPQPFSEEEDRAAALGIRGAELGPLGETFYFGIAGTNAVGDQARIPLFDPDQEAFLEYELARLIHELMEPEPAVVGLISGLDMGGGFDPAQQRMRDPWIVHERVDRLFELRELDGRAIDDDIDVLWVVHPRELPEQTLYAIDQFVLSGRPAVVFVDPHAEMDLPDPMNPMAAAAGRSSTLAPLFDTWGIEPPDRHVVLDDAWALSVSGGMGRRPQRHLGIFGVRRDGLARDQIVTGQLDSINFAYPGAIRLTDDSPLALTPLVTSSDHAGLGPVAAVTALEDPAQLRDLYTPAEAPLVLAGHLRGEVPSAFPDGPPRDTGPADAFDPPTTGEDDLAGEAGVDPLDASGSAVAFAGDHRARSEGPVNVLLVADTDVLTDRLWVQVQSFFGQRMPQPFASNGDFVINALEYVSGSEELLGLRGRATYRRPFTRVDELRREAEAQVSATLERLRDELAETEARLAELQVGREDEGALLLSPEQEAEIDRFRQRQADLRQELRQVQREREARIEALGTRLLLANTALIPALLVAGVLVALWLRRRRGAPR